MSDDYATAARVEFEGVGLDDGPLLALDLSDCLDCPDMDESPEDDSMTDESDGLPPGFENWSGSQLADWASRPGLSHAEGKRRARLANAARGYHHDSELLGRGSESPENREDRLAKVRETFPLLDIAALVDPNRPARRDLLADMIPEGEHASIVAPAGSGKSLLALALAVAAALGAEVFLGRTLTFGPRARVIYLDMENSEDDLSERLTSLGATPANVGGLSDRLLILHMPHLRGLDTREGGQELADVLDAYAIQAGDLLVLDSTQRVTEGDENANDTMRRLYNFTSAELKRRGVTVLRTDNTGWERTRERGASAKRDDVGASWLLVPTENDPEAFTLLPTKRRSKGTSESLTFRRWTDDAGLLRFDPAPPSSVATFADAMRAIRDLLDRLDLPRDLGHGKVWAAVQAERQRCENAGEDFPAGATQRLVRKAHDERRQVIVILPDDPADDLNPTDYDGRAI